MSTEPRQIAVDFDGVLHSYRKGYHDGTAYDEPMPGAKIALETIEAQGIGVVISTARPADDVRDWLKKWDFKDYPIFPKPKAMVYIDDRALRFTNWSDIKKYFL